jgi:hypothetical protein
MHELQDPARLLDQGEADGYARWFADQLDPMRHLDRYRRDLAIAFELGAEDRHIPAANARASSSPPSGVGRIVLPGARKNRRPSSTRSLRALTAPAPRRCD